jgi:DnaJ-class molecular chaperone
VTSTDVVFFAVLAGVLWVAGYFVACRIWPFTACRKCGGNGKRRSPSGRAFRRCPRCKGKGERLRTGRRVWNALAGAADRAQ